MAVLQMERFHICAMKRDRKKILEFLQIKGVVELKDVVVENDTIFSRADTSQQRAIFQKGADTAFQAYAVLNQYAPEKRPSLGFLRGRTALTPAQSDEFCEQKEAVLHKAQQILLQEREIAEQNAAITRFEAQQEALVPWLNLTVPQNFTGTRKTTFFVGAIPDEHTLNDIAGMVAEADPGLEPIHIEIVSAQEEQTCFYLIALKKDEQAADAALRSIGFARPASATHRLPKEKTKILEERIEKARKAVEEAKNKIIAFAGLQENLLLLGDHFNMRVEKYSAIEYLAQTRHVFVLDGYIPSKYAPAVIEQLETRYECAAEVTPVGPAEDPPVVLSNPWFTQPGETVLAMYSLPSKGEVDPTNIMFIFYFAMFGLMFSDAAYGIIMTVLCGAAILLFGKNMEPGWSRNVRLFFWCGISTIFWGIMFSSYFGDAIAVIAETFLGKPLPADSIFLAANAPFVDPVNEPITLLLFCLLIGIIHLTIGYIFKAINCAKAKDYFGILCEFVFPAFVIYPLIVILMGSSLFDGLAGWSLALTPAITNVCWVICLICVIGIILTNGRESKNPAIRILKGIYGLYNIVAGWLSDVLSYSRLLALGLATGVIASVMNQIGSMGGATIVGVVLFIVVFLIGQALNFGINVLGAYVHSNRLEFVEFFGKFYEGGGRPFAPLGIHTKYYKIEEESQNV